MANHAKHARGAKPVREDSESTEATWVSSRADEGQSPLASAAPEDGYAPDRNEPTFFGSSEADWDDVPAEPAYPSEGFSVFDDEPAAVGSFSAAHDYQSKKQSGAQEHHRHSRRMRTALLVAIVLLCILLAALGYFTVRLFSEVGEVAQQSASSASSNSDVAGLGAAGSIASDVGSSDRADKKVDIPVLIKLVGLDKDQVLDTLGDSAAVSSEVDITEKVETGEGDSKKEEEKVVGKTVTITLDNGAADSHGTVSSLYLTLDEKGITRTVGYSTSVDNLGYGNVSFGDAVSQNIVENSLAEAGVPVELGSAKLPQDASEYKKYSEDGSKVCEEKCTFTGTSTVDGKEYGWTVRLSYDYSAANVSDKLSDTIKLIYLYVGENS